MHPFLILAIAIAVVLISILVFRAHAFLALLLAAFCVAILTPTERLEVFAEKQVQKGDWTEKTATAFLDKDTAGVRVAKGFGATCISIGILIAMAAIIGQCLLESGAADRIIRTVLGIVGEKFAGVSFVLSGFLLGIPVFFDTVFYLMIPLGRATALRLGRDYLFYVLTIMAGATMAHSLVPPTPGPLIVVDKFGVNLTLMMVMGTMIGLVASSCGYCLAILLNRKIKLEVPNVESDDDRPAHSAKDKERNRSGGDSSKSSPPFLISIIPILLPVLLIGAATATAFAWKTVDRSDWPSYVRAIQTIGDKNVALGIAAAVSIGLVIRYVRTTRTELSEKMQKAIASAGIIILITAAGGAFGTTIRQSGIADEIASHTENIQPLFILPLAFIITTLIRTAQGSATVAMITAAGVLQGFAESDQLQFNVVYLALAVGCGSKPIAWMADSGFWVICKMSGMTEIQGLKTVTPMSIVMGVSGLIATMLSAWLIPLV